MPRFIRPRRRASSWLLRYRGYVYDSETGLYYLQSRYYDPSLSRFLNADAYTSTGQGQLGNNMFAYCNNNPVNMVDGSGFYSEGHALQETKKQLLICMLIGAAAIMFAPYEEKDVAVRPPW